MSSSEYFTQDQLDSCRLLSVTNLNASYNYLLPGSGIGATLTNSGAFGALSTDGIAVNLDDRIAVVGQTDGSQNGIYVVTNVGSQFEQWVLERASDFQSPGQFKEGSFFTISAGNLYAGETVILVEPLPANFGEGSFIFTRSSFVGLGQAAFKNVSDNTQALVASVNPVNPFVVNNLLVSADTAGSLKDSGVPIGNLNVLTTKGDLLTRNNSANVRLPVGSNGSVVTADSTQSDGIKWSSSLTDSSGKISINWQSRTMFDSTPFISADYNQRVLIDQNDVGSVYWGNDASGRLLTDAIGYIAVDWKNRLLKDNSLPQVKSIDWQNRKLYKSDGVTVSFDWNATLAENTIYVSNGGNDSTGNGSSLNPYLTIAHALASITTASPSNTFLIRVSAGIFNETTIALKPWVSIEGSGYFTTIINATNPIILSSADWTGLSSASLTIMKVNTNASTWDINFDALNASGNEIDFVDFYNPTGDMLFTGKTGAPCLVAFFQSQVYVGNLNFTNANIFMSDSFTEAFASFTNDSTNGTSVSSYFIAGQNLNTLVSSSDLTSTNVCQYVGMDIPGITASGSGTNIIVDSDSYKVPSLSSGATISPFILGTAGIHVKEGSNAKQGVATLVGGTVVVSNTSVTGNSRIFLTAQDNNTIGSLRVSNRVNATSFTITSSLNTDTGVVAYEIFESA